MQTEASPQTPAPSPGEKPYVKIFGIGKAGLQALEQLRLIELPDVQFVAVDADAASLSACAAPVKIKLEKKVLARLGQSAHANLDHQVAAVKSACNGAQTVILVAGMGGRTGTQMAVATARAAHEAGAHVFAFVTLPFDCEGRLHHAAARHGLEQLHGLADAVFCLPHQATFTLIAETPHLEDAFKISAGFIVNGVAHACRALAGAEVMGMSFTDLCLLICQGWPECAFAVAEAAGTNRSHELVEKLLSQPMLEGGKAIAGAETVMVSVVGGSQVRITEVNHLMQELAQHAREAPHIMGVSKYASLGDRLAVMVVAARPARAESGGSGGSKSSKTPGLTASTEDEPELDTQFLHKQTTARPGSRFVPPAPQLTPQQQDQLVRKHAGGGLRRHSPRLRQGQLQLDIVSKGRFDKTEPTVHKGEDLDVPTYIRRGVALN